MTKYEFWVLTQTFFCNFYLPSPLLPFDCAWGLSAHALLLNRLAMAIKEGDKFPMDSTFQIKGDAGPAVSPTLMYYNAEHPRRCTKPALRTPVIFFRVDAAVGGQDLVC